MVSMMLGCGFFGDLLHYPKPVFAMATPLYDALELKRKRIMLLQLITSRLPYPNLPCASLRSTIAE